MPDPAHAAPPGRKRAAAVLPRKAPSAKRATKKTKTSAVPPEQRAFARNLVRARRAAEMSQRDAHAKTGLAQSHISDIERCRANPSLTTMAKLARAVRVPLADLLRV